MLDELVVRNLGILAEARLEPGSGFTAITGETGTGKTLLLGALRLLLGGTARTDLVGPFAEDAAVEGRFLAPGGAEVAAGRRLSRAGRSRAYLDGSVASAAALDEATAGLVEIVGQHDQLALTRPAEVRAAVDRLLDERGRAALERYRAAWQRRRALADDQAAVGGDRRALERERDLAAYQAREIASAGIDPGEDRRLEARLSRLRHGADLRAHCGAAADGIDQARTGLGAAVAELRRAAALDPGMEPLAADLDALEEAVGEAARAVAAAADDLEVDPSELEAAETRMRVLVDLRRKYGRTLDEVAAYGTSAAERAEQIGGLLERADRLEADLAAADTDLVAAGAELAAARRAAAQRLAGGAVAHLVDLGFAEPLVEAEVASTDPGPWGADGTRLLFASDRRLAPGEIGRVASGGELSRLILALRLAGGAGEAATLVFDEIDSGVGGATALAVGRKLAALAADRQVLCVTHLPQVAAFADTHYVVRRVGNEAVVERVEGAERLEELSRMLAGLPDSERGRQAAEELVALARRG
jgi:DNA repair protein RecN (Recombination protein N)